MTNTDGKEDGIHAWMTSVRASMANDPCRQLFEDQVQTHAFIFLDDYLEHILAGPKQGPIIDLVKTPGRRKNVPRRTRAAAAKAKDTSLFSLGGNESAGDAVPVNSFHKALLQAKERSVQNTLDSCKLPIESTSADNDPVERQSTAAHIADIPEISISTESQPQANTVLRHHSDDSSSRHIAHFLATERGVELSVIAEGDESPERTRSTNRGQLPQTVSQPFDGTVDHLTLESVHIDPNVHGNTSQDPQHSAPSSANSYHSVSLNSPPSEFPRTGTSNHTEPLPARTSHRSPMNSGRDAFTEPLPVVPVLNSVQGSYDIPVPLNDSSPRSLTHKSGTAGFPTLPAPSPLRKSMRVTQEAVTSFVPPSVVPSAPLGKRTSWLMKAREAKAMEGASSLHGSSVATVAVTNPRVSVKRKSEEMLNATPVELDSGKDQRKSKVAKSSGADIALHISQEVEKIGGSDVPSVQEDPSAPTMATLVDLPRSHPTDLDQVVARVNSIEEGFIDLNLFKRTVEGLGARAGKSMGKSLGGAAAAALAEARAAAEAKVAERNKTDGISNSSETLSGDSPSYQEYTEKQTELDDQFPLVPAPRVEEAARRLSLSDLTLDAVRSNEHEQSAKMVKVGPQASDVNDSISTTPPDSPPVKGTSGFVKPVGPVFNKPPPPPVFMPPASKQPSAASVQPKELSSHLPSSQYSLPIAVSLGIPARLTSPPHGFPSRLQRTQPPVQSLQSSNIPDSTWIPCTQDTEYTSGSQPNAQYTTAVAFDDDDDSWPLEEKLAAAEPGWRPFDFSNIDKEDTWSSLPTESQGPTRSLPAEKADAIIPPPGDVDIDVEINIEDVEGESDPMEVSDAEHSAMDVSELEEAAGTETVSLQPAVRTASQSSMASTTSSSQVQSGFLSQATKLVNSVLGGGKKTKPELKSLQLAAAAAKRQQEEAEKKTQRLKDMETRRQVASAKKAEEERTRLLEEERKNKEESDKRKREREENTDRRPLKLPMSTKKGEEDTSKKRRLAPDTGKKSEVKKPLPKDKDSVIPTKPAATPVTKLAAQKNAKITTTALVSSTAYNSTQNAPPAALNKPIIPESKPFRVAPSSSLKGKAKARPHEDDIGDKLPSTMVQSQMAARAKAQMQAAKLPTLEVPSESIELPEINSEYSDSDDEDKVRSFDPPDWAQSPELRQALQMQSTMNPDSIFGAIRPLRMEEMFRTRQSRFRARTSSANWSGSDRLTLEEIREYERRMGFQKTEAS